MSNTSTVTPYASQNSNNGLGATAGTAAAVCAGAVVGTAAVAIAGAAAGAYGIYKLGRWLASEPPLSPEQLAEIREVEQEYQEKMAAMNASDLTTLNLHLQDTSTLVNTAAGLGYQVVQAPELSLQDVAAPIFLESNNGKRLAITQNEHGRVDIHAAADRDILHALVGRHTQERVLSHLTEKGMQFETARLKNGEMQILAHESNTGQPGGAAQIKAQVRKDGTTWVDIDRCRDRRCEDIVQQIAAAVGGTVTGTVKKDAWFQLPGEPTKTRVKT